MKNISYIVVDCAIHITWNLLGPNVTYCIQIVNSTTKESMHEVCGLEEPHIVLNVTWNVEYSFDIIVTAVTELGRDLPSNSSQVMVVIPGKV